MDEDALLDHFYDGHKQHLGWVACIKTVPPSDIYGALRLRICPVGLSPIAAEVKNFIGIINVHCDKELVEKEVNSIWNNFVEWLIKASRRYECIQLCMSCAFINLLTFIINFL